MTDLVIQSFFETLYMVLLSTFIAIVCGIPLGAFLFVTSKNGLVKVLWLNKAVGLIVNIIRSIPFIILLVAITPFTRLVVGTSIGVNAAIVPLAVSAVPFFARIVENALMEVPVGLIQATIAMGASYNQVVTKVLLREAFPNIINGITLTLITLVGYSAMAGAVGGGGLGDLAIRYGYQRFDVTIMIITVAILVLMVQCFQMIGDFFAKTCNKEKISL